MDYTPNYTYTTFDEFVIYAKNSLDKSCILCKIYTVKGVRMYRFPSGTRVVIDVVFRGEYRIGWEYKGIKYVPGSGSYYEFHTAMEKAWEAFCINFPEEKVSYAS